MFNATVGDVQKNLGVEYAVAGAIVNLLVSKAQARKVGSRPTTTGKGKPATIYELPETFTMSLTAPSDGLEGKAA